MPNTAVRLDSLEPSHFFRTFPSRVTPLPEEPVELRHFATRGALAQRPPEAANANVLPSYLDLQGDFLDLTLPHKQAASC